MDYIYGNFSDNQIKDNAKLMHNQIHKLLLHKDKAVENIIFSTDRDFDTYFVNLLYRFGGLNELLGEPEDMVSFMATLQSALSETRKENFRYPVFRKLIFDAHGYIDKMFGEVL